ncbi:MAG TPA: helix-turn-helix domain-containing protein [Pyrinomonadaceae bacterium]|jgi:cytoskeletal protein RodZ|nr:helix-turn-helix domain-containing protein [Pyrinomonadaceae bacterium]
MAASIGEQLRLAREERGIGLREICDQTRISVHYLEAIEANDYKRLPGGVFNRSFIKAYAKCVGYDEREAIEGYTRYLREHDDSSDDVNTTPMHSKVYTDTPATRSPLLTVFLAILILALLTGAALAALYWFQKRSAIRLSANSEYTGSMYNVGSPTTNHLLSLETDQEALPTHDHIRYLRRPDLRRRTINTRSL